MATSSPTYTRTTSRNLLPGREYRILEGKLAIITGASRGIGAAIAQNLASKGASLILNYTSESSAASIDELSKSLTDEYGSACLVVQADMGSKHGPEHIIKTAKTFFSRPEIPKFQIDIIINNAGVGKNQTIAEITLDKYEWQYRINVLGPLLLLQAALPYLPNDRSGRIVNVSSVSSSEGFIGQSVYGGTKAALEAMTRTWARELAERATINAINPGPVITDMWNGSQDGFKDHVRPFLQHSPLAAIRECIDHEELVMNAPNAGGRPAYPEEIGGIVGMLCTPDSAWCTGQVICANGGMRMVI